MITAYPLDFQIWKFHLTGFGIMMMLAFVVGAWLMDRELRRLGFAVDYAGDIVVAAVLGGIIGAKLWFIAIHPDAKILDRSGLVWYGGFLGGTIAVALNGWRRRVPVRWTAHLLAVALPAAYAVGRVGCFVVGDDYGVPTTLPWGIAFPHGMPPTTVENLRSFSVAIDPTLSPSTVLAVHPTQLYEVLAMLLVFAVLWRWRTRPGGTGWLFGAYLVFAGIERFLVEFLRAKDDRWFGALTVAQATSVVVVLAGIAVIVALRGRNPADPGPWLVRTQRRS